MKQKFTTFIMNDFKNTNLQMKICKMKKVADKELIYWSVRSSSMRGGVDGGFSYFSPLRVLLFWRT